MKPEQRLWVQIYTVEGQALNWLKSMSSKSIKNDSQNKERYSKRLYNITVVKLNSYYIISLHVHISGA